MKKQFLAGIVLCMLYIGLIPISAMSSQTIQVMQLSTAPTLDGNADDWQQVPPTTISVAAMPGDDIGVAEIQVKAGISGDSVYFLWQWQDDSEDIIHKPYIWDAKAGKYQGGPQMEDRFAVNFSMEGEFTYDWYSGQTFRADMWHWKAARTNPMGLAHDKMTIITTEPSKKSFKATAKNGTEIYIIRPSDAGDKLYSTKRYAVKEKNMMPKYILAKAPQGSITDVKAKGIWKNGTWTLEFKRLLNTGHADDVVFHAGDIVPASIAVFNHSGDDQHNISETINFQF